MIAHGLLPFAASRFVALEIQSRIARRTVGMMKDARQKQRATSMLRRLRRKPLLRITGETGEVFGSLAAKLEQAGRGSRFRIQDLWLAAQAVQRDFTVLTANIKDFQDVPGLKFVGVPVP